ncbi:NAD(P)-dependent oxidoreductase [Pseudarthrobacter sp. AL07]|uniref:NAD-dependent epimerase/dehydratase family protein n=1 Tax=unclassified Pseudarthrobacter TaxID=2647000 RepID=UPI002499F19E|nr:MULTISPECIES: NAD(P)-dependent oxidoreductase [unclassified Pseudarthrobacter]MDI3196004.1 NAD(P)-dependent oxidoreductase [Pseudarthrobacter sp. AL20]MDI3210055.1 NAD(P)-dependent oxidoreductase [Pseudarthrobacter sp. AL07]
MKVLITGASGRLGLVLSEKLKTRPGVRTTSVISPRSNPMRRTDIKLDMADFNGLKNLIQSVEPDVIFHLAGVSGSACDLHPELAHEINVTATQVLCDAAAVVGTSRVVFASTAAIYGDQRLHAVSEVDAVDLRSTYAKTKFHAEEILRETTNSATFSGIALRIFNIYGENFKNSLVRRLLESTPANPIRLQGFDTFVRDYVHSDDVVDAMLLALDLPPGSHMVFNIGSGIPTTNRHLVQVLSARNPIHYELGDPVDSFSCADISLARDVLRFVPARTLRELWPATKLR